MTCKSGWTSLGDLSFNTPGPDCLINYLGIRIMSFVCIIVSSFCNILVIWYYISLAKRNLTCLSWKKPSTLFPLNFLLLGISSLIHGCLKLAYPSGQQPLIGRDLSITLISFSFSFNAFCGITIYTNLVLHFLTVHSEMIISEKSCIRVKKRFSVLRFYSWFLIPFSFVICIMPLIGLSYPHRARAFGITYLIGLAVICFIVGIIVIICLNVLLKELRVHIQSMNGQASEELKTVVSRLSKVKFLVSGTLLSYSSSIPKAP